jgi:hypothetical protein
MIDERWAALGTCGLALPQPIITGGSWFGDSKLMRHIRQQHQGTVLVEGKTTYSFP